MIIFTLNLFKTVSLGLFAIAISYLSLHYGQKYYVSRHQAELDEQQVLSASLASVFLAIILFFLMNESNPTVLVYILLGIITSISSLLLIRYSQGHWKPLDYLFSLKLSSYLFTFLLIIIIMLPALSSFLMFRSVEHANNEIIPHIIPFLKLFALCIGPHLVITQRYLGLTRVQDKPTEL